MTGLFSSERSRIYSIPAGANFLQSMATVLADELDLITDPEALADALIYVPNRRSERALAFSLFQTGKRQASLLPDIRALGDLETDEPPPSAEAALADLPPVISPAARIGGLTRLVMAYFDAQGTALPAASCLSAARELARLLDQAALSGEVDWGKLESDLPDLQLSEHWQQSAEFLKIITEQWPAELEDATRMDPYARRYAAAVAMVEEWRVNPPETPVIIAGSTGATPASRLLMKAAMTLPQGLVILPGLDRELSDEALSSIAETPSHPQFALARTLTDLGLTVDQVEPWPSAPGDWAQSARRRLVHEALAPAQNTADWTDRLAQISEDGDTSGFVEQALSGLTLLEAKDETDEALLAALILRETLERDGETAALVTPDAGLARHVSAMLKRWEVDVAPSAGLPLTQTDAGSFVGLVADWLLDPSHPVALLAVLNHPSSRFDKDVVTAFDKACLRGPRVWQTWEALCTRIGRNEDFVELMSALNSSVSGVLADQSISGEDWYRTVSHVATSLGAHPQPWSGEDGAEVSRLLRHLTELAGPLGLQAPPIWNEIFQSEALTVSVQSQAPHPRLAIWGPLEARLQTADRIVLAGLNEGIWPAQPAADAFLPRVFREKIGLTDPDERIGLSAHDFAQLASAPVVTLLSSQRRDDKPAVASRWLWRLKTLARGALGDAAAAAFSPPADNDPAQWLEALERAPDREKSFTAEPRPTPPLHARPSGLSVTRIEQLVRDPYAIYCEYVLGLRRLDPLNLATDVRVRGTAIHKALERFELEDVTHDGETLLSLVEQELRDGGEPGADIVALRNRRRDVCEAYLIWRDAQAHALEGNPITEERGEFKLKIGDASFTLSGTADRIEKRIGGGSAVLDFKSGRPPSEKQVRAGLSPQMPLQGLIAREGGYEKLGKSRVDALTYIRFGTAFEVREIGGANARAKVSEQSVEEIITAAEAGLIRLLTAFADPGHPYLSAPRPERVSYESDYTRLARRDEWAGLSTYD